MVHRSDIAVVGVKAVVAVACSVLVALVSRDSQHMQVAVVVEVDVGVVEGWAGGVGGG